LPETVGAICADHGNVYSGQDAYSGRLIAEGGCYWNGEQVTQTLDAVLSKGQMMPEKSRFPAVLVPEVSPPIAGCSNHGGANGPGRDVDSVLGLIVTSPSHWDGGPHPTLNRPNGSPGYSDQELFSQRGSMLVSQSLAYPLQDGRELDKRQNGLGIGDANDPAYTVDCTGAQAVALAQQPVREVAATIGQRMRGLDDSCADNLLLAQQAVPFVKAKRAQSADDDETWEANRPAPTLNTFDVCDTRATVAVVEQPIAFHHNAQACQLPSEHRDTRVTDTLTVSQNAAVATSLAVRRLTPRECERLQGFPDDYTAIVYRNKPAADGPRYKAMGNSMAVNCMAWIGERIAAVNARIEAALEVQP